MDLICKYVVKNGKSFGESIDEYGEYLIIKVSSEFIAVPKNCIKKVDGELIEIDDFNESEAKEVGQKWMEEKSRPVSLDELKSYGFGEK